MSSPHRVSSFQFAHKDIQGWNDCPDSLIAKSSNTGHKHSRPRRTPSYASYMTNSSSSVLVNSNSSQKYTLPPTSGSSDKLHEIDIKKRIHSLLERKTRLPPGEYAFYVAKLEDPTIYNSGDNRQFLERILKCMEDNTGIDEICREIDQYMQEHRTANWCMSLRKVVSGLVQ